MSGKEPAHRLYSLEEVASVAKEVTLKDGFHRPTVIAQGDVRSAIAQITELDADFEVRVEQMFALGMMLAAQAEVGVLQQAFFICEGWLSIARGKIPPILPPSQDPARKEVLTVSGLKMTPRKVAMKVLEMKRNRAGELVAIDELKAADEADLVDSPLLEAFVMGFGGE